MKKVCVLFLLMAAGSVMLFAGGGGEKADTAAKGGGFTKFERDISWIIPFAAGGSTDVQNRRLASMIEKDIGVSIVVTNVVGGGGSVGYRNLINAPTDGYTVGATTSSVPLLKYTNSDMKSLSYDLVDWVAIFATNPATLSVPANSPFKNMKDFLDYAKANPGKVRISNSGIGSTWHGVMLTLESKTGAKFSHIPYEGGPLSAAAAAGGHVEAVACALVEVFPLLQNGNLRCIGISGDQRDPAVPNVQTFKEQGIEGMWGSFVGFSVPKGYPPAAKAMLENSVRKSVATDDWKNFAVEAKFSPNLYMGEELKKFLADLDKTFQQIF